ncbi:iron complex transport system ATP-binding protein [Vibrio gazogenes DSM 21264]|uniref:Iron complex transport system ATP-binding protein n=2 Tax=Vibrio gazogenes TaxID=687 RepID=A0A1M4UQ73_VIBGA|nr:iron complex transport system ATP-binding protein [Vibrio gazogenes DSM 21264] [Vibrio gazogenes DSM 21264 = NBRC 103151]
MTSLQANDPLETDLLEIDPSEAESSKTAPLKTESLLLGYGKKTIINSLNLTIQPHQITALVGGNGCGKSTLLKSLARLLKPQAGEIFLYDKNLNQQSGKAVARRLAILPQGPVAPEGLSVEQLVRQGRYPHQNWLNSWGEKDERLVQKALLDTNMLALAKQSVESLSGGQRQRAWIAMALAQDTDVLLLDEPTTYLDLTHQIEILDLLFELNQKQHCTILMVLHDLNLACRYAHQMIAVKDGTVFRQGAPEDILDVDMVESVFGMKCHITRDPLFGTPMCIPYGKGRSLSDDNKNNA